VKPAKRVRGFLALLPADVLDRISSIASHTSYADGQMIHARGDSIPGFSLIMSGKVRFGSLGQSGNFSEFAIMPTGDAFGEMTVLAGLKRVHDAYSVGPADLQTLSEQAFKSMMATSPEFQAAVLKMMARRLKSAYDRIEDVLRLPLIERIAQYLIENVRRGESGSAVKMRQSDVAEAMSASRVSVSKALGKLAGLGYVRTGYGRIDVTNLAGLTGWLAANADLQRV
jgi:CRP/FNR family transcriptional regulator, cyclic AMP receptor protein